MTAVPSSSRLPGLGLALLLTLIGAGAAGGAAPAAAQRGDTSLVQVPSGEEGWNTERTLELVERARERRREPVADSTLRSYRAEVAGHIYFFLDREEDPEPVLLRADQVALQLYWGQPSRVKQVVVGMRSEEQFPIKNFRYYVDRYTVIQNGFDDVIRVGEGRDVRNVIHPLAREGRYFYHFRLADSTTLRLPGRVDPIRVYEIQVRPAEYDAPGIVGSLFVERARADLVRLAFTFTPASYRDPRNDRVEVVLENALWEGRWWLPREQRLLVRREIPELDLDVGTVIRGALTVRDYAFNPDLPAGFFEGRDVAMAGGPEALAEYTFDEGLYDGFEEVGLAAEPGTLDAVDVDRITGRILRQRLLSGVPRVRFHAPTASDVLRYDRSEGLVLGAGASYGLGRSRLFGYGGWAFGAERPVAAAGWTPTGRDAAGRWSVDAHLNRPADIGLRPAAAGVLATLSAAALGRDLRDVHPVSGVRIGWTTGSPLTRSWSARLAFEHHPGADRAVATAPFDDERAFRPAVPVFEDQRFRLDLAHERRLGSDRLSVRIRPSATAVARPGVSVPLADETAPDSPRSCPDGCATAFGRLALDIETRWRSPDLRSRVRARATGAALTTEDVPPQDLLYIGGRNTLPGHPLHGYAGTRAVVVDVVASRALLPRLVQLRLLGAAGWAGPDGTVVPVPAPDGPFEPWSPAATGGLAASAGIGAGLVDGVVRIDWVVRTDTGKGSLLLSVDPRFWPFL